MDTKSVATAFEKYPAYKDSGVEWLGMIPEGWRVSRFRNEFSFSKGLTITKENLQETGIACINYGEVHSKHGFELEPIKNRLKSVDEIYIQESPKSLLNNYDFVFADTSEDIEGSGNFIFFKSEEPTFAGYHTIIAKPRETLKHKYIAYLFDSITFRFQIRRMVKGVKVYSITNSILKDTIIWTPSLEEKNRIANFLDEKTAKIDRVIAQKERLIELLKERKQVIVQDAVTGKVNCLNWDLQDSPINGINATATRPMKPSGVEWIGEIPEGWEVKKLKNICFHINSNVDKLSKSNEQEVKLCNYVDVYKNDRITSGIDFMKATATIEQIRKFKIRIGDVIITKDSEDWKDIGIPSYVDFEEDNLICGYHLAILRPIGEVVGKFLFFALKAEMSKIQFGLNANGVTRYGLPQNGIKNILVVFPAEKEQIMIVKYIEREIAKLEAAISNQHQQIEKLKEYKAVLIDSAVTGKIKVTV